MSKVGICAKELIFKFNALTMEELKDYGRDVLTLAHSDKTRKGMAAIEAARKEVNDAMRSAFFDDAQTVIANQEKLAPLAQLIENAKATLRDIVGVRYENKGGNIEIAQKAAQNRMLSLGFGKLKPEDFAYLEQKSNQMDIADVFDGYKPSSALSAEAAQAAKNNAENLKKYFVESTSETIISGALPLRFAQNRRFFGAVHDRASMIKGGRGALLDNVKNLSSMATTDAKLKWREVIKSKLNMEETFAATDAMEDGVLNLAEADKIIDRVFDNILNGRSEIFTKSVVLNDAEAIAQRSRMFFVYKNMRSFLEYNEVYGQGDLLKAFMHDAEAKGRQIGRAELMGSNADVAYAKLKDVQQATDPKSPKWNYYTDLFYKEVRGDSSASMSPTLANFAGNVRSLSAVARLGTLIVQSLTDANMAAAYASKWGGNYFKNFTNQFESVIAPASSEERKELGRMFHVNLKAHLGYMGKLAEAETASDVVGKFTKGFFRATGMERWDKGNRIGSMENVASILGMESKNKLGDVNKLAQKQLSKHGIDANEWDVLRKYSKDGSFSLDNVESLTHDDLLKIYNARGGTGQLYQIKNELYRKVYSVFEAAQENAILTPGAWVKTLMNQGTVKGTWAGEAWRMFTQFKGFPLSYMDRALIEGFHDAEGMSGKLYYALQQFGFALPLSYMSTWAYFMGQGKSMPDPSEMSFAENVSFFAGITAPGLGIALSILDPGKQDTNMASAFLLTPALRLLGASVSTPLSLMTGNPDKALKNLTKSLEYIAPVSTLPIASPYIKKFLGDKPYLQPGQTQLYGG